jgi:hypothetical protein
MPMPLMRFILACASLRALFAAAGPPTPAVHDAARCTPVDSGPVVAWHQVWDHADLSQAIYGNAQSGVLDVAPLAHVGARLKQVTGRFALTVSMLRQAAPDQLRTYLLDLTRPSGLERRRMEADDGWLPDATALRGRLISLDTATVDTIPVVGALHQDQWFAFGPAEGFLGEDGESYTVVELTSRGFRGWYTDGALAPTPLGFFCAERVG